MSVSFQPSELCKSGSFGKIRSEDTLSQIPKMEKNFKGCILVSLRVMKRFEARPEIEGG